MTNSIRNIVNVFKREVHLIAHDVNIISVLFLAPLFYAFFYGSIYINKIETDVPIAVVDMDHSDVSQKLRRMLDAHQLIAVHDVPLDYNSAKIEMENGDIQGIVFIPKGFEADLKSGSGADMKIYMNTTKFLVSNDINKAVNEVVGTLSMSTRLKYFQANGYSYEQSKEMIEPVRLEMRPLFNYTESYGDFLVPAILVLIVQQTLLIGLSESVAKEREQNTLPELYGTANKSILSAINGKGLFYLTLYSAYALFFYTVNFYVLKLSFLGSALALALLTMEMILGTIYISIFVSSFFKRKIFALQFLTLSTYPLFLISGYSWPPDALPWYLNAVANMVPLTPYLNGFVRITQMGAGWADVFPQIFHMAVIVLVAFIAAALRMNKLFKQEHNINSLNRG